MNIDRPWGFDQDYLPDKNGMTNFLFTLNPNNMLFKCQIHECLSILIQEELKIIQSFNTSYGRQSQRRSFKRSKTQSIEYKQQVSQLKNQNLKNKKKLKKQQIINQSKQIQELAVAIQEEHQA